MKKRFFAVFAAVLFTGTNYAIEINDTEECEVLAVEIHEALLELGVPHKEAFRISGEALEACENAQIN